MIERTIYKEAPGLFLFRLYFFLRLKTFFQSVQIISYRASTMFTAKETKKIYIAGWNAKLPDEIVSYMYDLHKNIFRYNARV